MAEQPSINLLAIVIDDDHSELLRRVAERRGMDVEEWAHETLIKAARLEETEEPRES